MERFRVERARSCERGKDRVIKVDCVVADAEVADAIPVRRCVRRGVEEERVRPGAARQEVSAAAAAQQVEAAPAVETVGARIADEPVRELVASERDVGRSAERRERLDLLPAASA